MRDIKVKSRQAGVFMLEALIGILIFFIGALAMIALQANGIAAQSDAQYRIEAANMVDRIIGQMTISANRSNPTSLPTPPNLAASLALLAYNTAGLPASCSFTGGAVGAGAVDVGQWSADVTAAIPGSINTMHQVLVDSANFNKVTVTVCWQTGSDATPRRHSVIAFVN